MWLEAILGKDDLARAATKLGPLRIGIGKEGHVRIFDPREVELIADVGLRLKVTAEIHWPVLGIQIPVSVRSATLEVRPEVVDRPGGEALRFGLHLDDIDVSLFPGLLDHRLAERVNKELEGGHVELCWGYARTLSHVFDLPEEFVTAHALGLRVAGGRVKVTSDAVAFAVLMDATVSPRVADARPSATEA